MNSFEHSEKNKVIFFGFFNFLQKPKVKKLISVFLLVLFLGTLLPVRFASANIIGDILNWVKWLPVRVPVTFMVIPLYIIAFITLPFVGLSGLLVHWVMSPGFTSFPYTKPGPVSEGGNPVIQAGLQVTFPIANMFIILALVFIAIATILRIESYSLRKLLPMLIIVALLVNFAPVLCGVVVDFANVFMNFFAGHVGGLQGMSKIAKTLWGEGGFWGDIISMWGMRSGTEMATYISPIAKTLSVIIYNAVASLILLMYFVLLFLRYIMIWLLVILSPLAIVSYVLPFTKKYFVQWWNQLIQWSFIGVVAAFFLYLSAQTLSLIGSANLQPPAADTAWLTELMNGIMPAIFACILLVIGFFSTLKSGGMFAGAVAGAVAASSQKISKWAGEKTMGGTKSFMGKQYNKEGKETARYKMLKGLENRKYIGKMIGGPGALTGIAGRHVEARADKMKEKYNGYKSEDLNRQLSDTKVFTPKNAAKAAGMMKVLTERGGEDMGDHAGVAKKLEQLGYFKTVKEAKKVRPSFEKDRNKRRTMLGKMQTDERRKINPLDFARDDVFFDALSTMNNVDDFRTFATHPDLGNVMANKFIGLSHIKGTTFEKTLETQIGSAKANFIKNSIDGKVGKRTLGIEYDATKGHYDKIK